ncbi:MAG: hypothetical protein ACOX5W_01905 [Bacillota bacterium]|jgi:hypothetical protein
MAWFIALLGLLGVFVFFLGAAISMFKLNKSSFKKCMIGFMVSFIVAFIAVGLH